MTAMNWSPGCFHPIRNAPESAGLEIGLSPERVYANGLEMLDSEAARARRRGGGCHHDTQ